MFKHIKYLLYTIILILIQTKVLSLISLNGIVPDILTILIIYIAIKHGQLTATIWGFVIGLIFDFSVGNFIGLSAFSKTTAGFTAGYFYEENKWIGTITSYRFLIIVLICSLISNIIYSIIYTRGSEMSLWHAIFLIGISTTLYTTIFSFLIMLTFSRKYSKLHV